MITPPSSAPGLRLMVAIAAIAFGAQLIAESEDLVVSMSSGVVSRHLYRGVERSNEAWQVVLNGAVRGWRGRVWSSRPIDSTTPGELRSALGYIWSKTKALSIESSGTHFWYVDAPVAGAAAHSFEANLRMIWTTRQNVRWVVESGYDIRFRSIAMEGSLEYDLPLNHWGTYLEGRVYLGNVQAKDVLPDAAAAGVRDAYSYWGADLRLPYRISWHTTLAVDAHYTEATGANRYWSPSLAGPGRRAWMGLSVIYEF